MDETLLRSSFENVGKKLRRPKHIRTSSKCLVKYGTRCFKKKISGQMLKSCKRVRESGDFYLEELEEVRTK